MIVGLPVNVGPHVKEGLVENQKDLVNLLQRFNLVNTVIHPTGETNHTSSSIDVMIINRIHYTNTSNIYELGLSDHYAQILTIMHKNIRNTTVKIWKKDLMNIIYKSF
jgi:DNA-binding LytR/AlgR family response regulator